MRISKILVIISAVLIAGCATGRRFQDLETRVGILDGRISTIEQRQGIVESQTGDSRESVGYLKGKVESIPFSPTGVGTGAKGSEGVARGIKPPKLSKKDIQRSLKNANFYNGPIDGVMGKKTKKAIREFQRSMGLKADGVVGLETAEKLVVYLTN